MKTYRKHPLAFRTLLRTLFLVTFAINLSLNLTGCATKVVSVIEEKEFMLMTQRFGQVLYRQKILDSKGQFIVPIVPIAQTFYLPDDLGLKLYSRLSPDFYSQSLNSTQHVSMKPTSFARIKSESSAVRFTTYGFTLTQKESIISVGLLASTDWNGDGNDDYIILARIKSNATKEIHDYYLVVENIKAQKLVARVIGTYNYKTKKTENYGKAKTSTFEIDTIEVKAGSRPVVLPRDTKVKTKDTSETSLSE